MSYGVWKYKGKNWSAIEIDGGGEVEQSFFKKESNPRVFYMVCRQAANYGLIPDYEREPHLSLPTHDIHFLAWAVYQKKVGRTIYEVETGADHAFWFACLPQDVPAVLQEKDIAVWSQISGKGVSYSPF